MTEAAAPGRREAAGTIRLGLHFRLASSTFSNWDRLYAGCLEQAEAAEAAGFDCIVVGEHHFQEDGFIPSPYIVLGGIAARTRRLRLGTGVRPLPMIHPIRAAEDIAVLDNLSGGRAIAGAFGLGGRAGEYAGFGIPFGERRRRHEEALQVVDRLLAEERVCHDGQFFRIDGLSVTPRPVQRPRPPLWIAGSVEPAIERAARLGDAWFTRPLESLAELKRLTNIYKSALRGCGKDWQAVEHIVRRDGWIAENDEAAWREALPALQFHYTRDYAFFPRDATLEYMRDFGRDRFVIGSPETMLREIRRYQQELGTTLLIVALDSPGLEPSAILNAICLFGERVIPYL